MPHAEAVIVDQTGLGAYEVIVRTITSSFLMDEPVEVGGLGSGPNPYDMLCAAIGSCTIMTVRMYARRKDWPLLNARAKIGHRREVSPVKDVFTIGLELDGPLDEAQRTRILDVATRCPVQQTIARGSEIVHEWLAAPQVADKSAAVSAHQRDMLQVCERC